MARFDESTGYPGQMANRADFDAVQVERALFQLLTEYNGTESDCHFFRGSVPVNIGGGIGIVLNNDDPGVNLRLRNYDFSCEGYNANYELLIRHFGRLSGLLPFQGITVGNIYFISILPNGPVYYRQNGKTLLLLLNPGDKPKSVKITFKNQQASKMKEFYSTKPLNAVNGEIHLSLQPGQVAALVEE